MKKEQLKKLKELVLDEYNLMIRAENHLGRRSAEYSKQLSRWVASLRCLEIVLDNYSITMHDIAKELGIRKEERKTAQ